MNNPKKILIFSTAYFPFVGGAEVAIKEITDRIFGTEFDLITARLERRVSKGTLDIPERVGNVNVYRIGFGFRTLDKILLPFWGAIKAIKLNNKKRYDYFWCVMVSFASGAAYIANILKFWKPVPIVLSLQEGDSEEHFRKKWFGLIDLSWKLALKRTNRLTVLSSYLKERALRLGYKGEVRIIPNGVDVEKFEVRSMNYELRERQEIRAEMGIGKDDIVLITTSRLVVKNGVGDVIKALLKLDKNIKFLILGDGELKDKLKKLTKDLSIENRVIFKGNVEHSVIYKYLKASDIFIRASLSEGFGNSFIEAMAAGLPVIATPVGGIVDFLQDGNPSTPLRARTGYFCEPENPESVAEVVKRVISDPNKDQVVENAYKMVVEKYDWNLISRQMRGIFNQNYNG